jgi:hypothetical protein
VIKKRFTKVRKARYIVPLFFRKYHVFSLGFEKSPIWWRIEKRLSIQKKPPICSKVIVAEKIEWMRPTPAHRTRSKRFGDQQPPAESAGHVEL